MLLMIMMLALLALPFLAVVAIRIAPISAHGFGDHMHLLPTTPRSITETRRMGLA